MKDNTNEKQNIMDVINARGNNTIRKIAKIIEKHGGDPASASKITGLLSIAFGVSCLEQSKENPLYIVNVLSQESQQVLQRANITMKALQESMMPNKDDVPH